MELSHILSGKWKQISGMAQKTWGKLTDDELAEINGNKDILLGKLQEKYGWTKQEAEDNISDFYDGIKDKFSDTAEDIEDAAGDVKDDAEGMWDSLVSKVKSAWEDFTDDDLKELKHDKDALLEKVQKKYNITKEEAQEKLGDMFK